MNMVKAISFVAQEKGNILREYGLSQRAEGIHVYMSQAEYNKIASEISKGNRLSKQMLNILTKKSILGCKLFVIDNNDHPPIVVIPPPKVINYRGNRRC